MNTQEAIGVGSEAKRGNIFTKYHSNGVPQIVRDCIKKFNKMKAIFPYC